MLDLVALAEDLHDMTWPIRHNYFMQGCMPIEEELYIIAKLAIAVVLGAVIGFDRERFGMSAGIRTYAAVCLGATLFTDIGENMNDVAANSRIISNIIVGVGFLGAGIIYKNESTSSSHGLTTAATVWCTAGIGVAVGLDMFIIAVVATASIFLLLTLHRHRWYKRWKERIRTRYKGETDND